MTLPARLLLDTNIWVSTVTHNWILVPQTLRRGSTVTTVEIARPRPRSFRNKTQEDSDRIYEALKRIAEMAKAGQAILYESDEILLEGLNLRQPGLRGTEFDVFHGVRHQRARAPLSRTAVIDYSYSPDTARRAWQEFLSQIRHPRFLALKKATGGNHLADLYHVWEAEHNSLEYFVTLDAKFVNAVSNSRHFDSVVRVCTPTQLVALMPAAP
jgi:uncharacterized protein